MITAMHKPKAMILIQHSNQYAASNAIKYIANYSINTGARGCFVGVNPIEEDQAYRRARAGICIRIRARTCEPTHTRVRASSSGDVWMSEHLHRCSVRRKHAASQHAKHDAAQNTHKSIASYSINTGARG
jgi:hypothetical protein